MADHLQVGYRFGRFEIRRVLHRDRVSVEYEASITGEDRRVTIKEYLPEGLAERRDAAEVRAGSAVDRSLFDAGLARFLAQFGTLGRIDHPAIVTVYECLRANGTGYAVLDYPAGETLAARLQGQSSFSVAELASVFRPIVDGLDSVHLANLLHREINLDNIVIQPGDSPLLRGFGAATVAAGGPRQAFSPRQPGIVGLLTPGYAALEQYSDRAQEGPWTDIYALGAAMYRCVTGASPADALSRAVEDDMIPAARAAKGAFDRQTLAGIDAALGLRVAERPQSLTSWRTQLPALGQQDRTTAAVGGRLGARQFPRQSTASPTGAQTSSISPQPAVSARSMNARPRLARRPSRTDADQPGPNWAVPALAATVLVSLLTWLDTGVLRSAPDREDGGSAPVETLLQGEPELAARPRPSATTQHERDETSSDTGSTPITVAPAGAHEATLASRPAAPSDNPERRVVETASLVGSRVQAGTEVTSGDAVDDAPLFTMTRRDKGHKTEATQPASGVDAVDTGQTVRPQEAAMRGSLTMDLSPADAEVSFLGDAAPSFRSGMTLPNGAYRVQVSSAGYRPITRSLEVSGDTRVNIVLTPEPQPFSISTVPAGATVRFAELSTSYAPGLTLPPGEYRMTASLPGYETWEGVVRHGTAPTRRQVTLSWMAAELADPLSSGGTGPTMVSIARGSFQMGCVTGRDCFTNELPLRNVVIEYPFALSKYEVTYDDYDRFTRATQRRRAEIPADWERGNRPVVNVSWEDAATYARWLSSETGRRYRLPSEVEWEYAARARTDTAYSWGNKLEDGRANCNSCGSGQAHRGTVRVGSFTPNPWGLHDMHGNVWEWVADCSDSPRQPRQSIDADSLAARCASRVRRGGSWVHSPRRMRSASRDATTPDLRSLDTGFRVLLQVE